MDHPAFSLRAPAMEDVEAVTDLINACALADTGVIEYTVAELRAEWQAPDMQLDRDTRITVTPEGPIVGFVEFACLDAANPEIDIYLYVHPDYREGEIGVPLLRFAEARAQQAQSAQASGKPVVLYAQVGGANTLGRLLLEREGYRFARRFWQMQKVLDAPPPPPQWPEGITARAFVRHQDEDIVYEVRKEAYADMWRALSVPRDVYFYYMIEGDPHFDPALWFLAQEGEDVVGICLCSGIHNGDPQMGWVKSLAVRRQWRGRGVGTALLAHAFGEFYRRGKRIAGLHVDSASPTGATRLYERAGMQPAHHLDDYAKVLPPPG